MSVLDTKTSGSLQFKPAEICVPLGSTIPVYRAPSKASKVLHQLLPGKLVRVYFTSGSEKIAIKFPDQTLTFTSPVTDDLGQEWAAVELPPGPGEQWYADAGKSGSDRRGWVQSQALIKVGTCPVTTPGADPEAATAKGGGGGLAIAAALAYLLLQ